MFAYMRFKKWHFWWRHHDVTQISWIVVYCHYLTNILSKEFRFYRFPFMRYKNKRSKTWKIHIKSRYGVMITSSHFLSKTHSVLTTCQVSTKADLPFCRYRPLNMQLCDDVTCPMITSSWRHASAYIYAVRTMLVPTLNDLGQSLMAKVACRKNLYKVNGLLGKKEEEEDEQRKKI